MIGWKPLAAIAPLLGAAATPAQACRELQPGSYDLAAYQAVVLARVSAAQEVEAPWGISWRLRAEAVRTVSGSARPGEYEYEVLLFSDGCRPQPLPEAGELWVLYFRENNQNQQVDLAFPRDWVEQIDPRVLASPAPDAVGRRG